METISKQIIEQAQAGNQEAFSALYQATYGRNYYVALKMVKREADTEDILQDAYVKIFHNLKKFTYTGENSFASWTTKIVSNTALDFLRKKSPVLFSEMGDDDDEAVFDIEDLSVDNRPDLSLDQKETSRIVQELLDELSDEQRICIILYYVEQLSIAEIAEQCGCSEGTIKSRLRYARIKLQGQGERLEREGIHLKKMAPMALLLFLLRQEAAQAAEKSAPALELAAMISGKMAGSAAADPMSGVESAIREGGLAAKKISTMMKVLLVTGGVLIGATGSYMVQGLSGGNQQKNPRPVSTVSAMPDATARPTEIPKEEGIVPTAVPEELPTDIPDNGTEVTPKTTATEETVSKPDKEPAGNSTPKPTKKVAKKPTKKPVEKVSKHPTSKPTAKASKKPTKKPAVKASKKPAKKATPKPTKKSEDNPDWDDDYVDWDE